MRGPIVNGLSAQGGFCLPSLLFATLTGLADGLALKELRYAADAGDSPQQVGPPLPAVCRRRFSGSWRQVSKR